MNTTYLNTSRTSAAMGAPGAVHFVASLDSASLPDMGDRSLDQETHAYIKPRRRHALSAPTVVRRRSGLPFPEPRLPDLGASSVAGALRPAEVELRQVEENAGLRFIRASEIAQRTKLATSVDAVESQSIHVAAMAELPSISRFACSGPTLVVPPKARETVVVSAPAFDMNRQLTVVRRTARIEADAEPAPAAKPAATRFASLEGGIARMSEHSSVRIAVLAIGVSGGILSKVRRLSDVLRDSYSRRVEVLAAENYGGLELAPRLSGGRAGEVLLVSHEVGPPHRTIPFLSSFDGVILMVEIGETPVDDAAAWAEALRRSDVPLVGVWAA